jgi:hypothetical protein
VFGYKINSNFVNQDALDFGPDAAAAGSDEDINSVMNKLPADLDLFKDFTIPPHVGKREGGFLPYLFEEAHPEQGMYDFFDESNYMNNCFIDCINAYNE